MAGPAPYVLRLFALLLPFAAASSTEGQSLLQVKTHWSRLIPPAKACSSLVNHGTYFTIDVEIGTPGQRFSVVADTGSNTLIVPSCICQTDGYCRKSDRCFVGTNRSSTFTIPGGSKGAQPIYLSFGSGDIGGVIAQDKASVGALTAFMKQGFVLMTEKELDFGGSFEGICGLGMPQKAKKAQARAKAPAGAGAGSIKDAFREIIKHITGSQGSDEAPEDAGPEEATTYIWSGRADQAPDVQGASTEPTVSMPPGFLEQAGVGRFSMCFNYEAEGVLRLGTPPSAYAHGSLGTTHWGLGLWGVSVGKTNVPVKVCSPEHKEPGHKSPCGAIPDSGTTFIMAPADHVAALLETVCDQWDRCRENHTAMVKAARDADTVIVKDYGTDPFGLEPLPKAVIAKLLLVDCDRWLDEAHGLDELPSIDFHVRGSGGTKQSLSLPARAYVVKQEVNASVAARMNISASTNKICYPALGSMEYTTADNGPVWILGTPLFYEFNVGYDMHTDPPSMSFTSAEEEPCGSCDKKAGLIATDSMPRRAHWPRTISGPPRLPSSLDVHRPM